MKKLLFVFAIAGALVACDNDGTSNATQDSVNKDSVVVTPDTTVVSSDTTAVIVDTTAKADTTTKK